uniref:AP2/ERF domain-containing transcription factor n=1 Tax=Vernicia montana TaxID=316732 RepID=A0A1L6CAV8_9ROSI|nr:AP2/ERF domain-containing transcription factor [Vernicia montana]
MDNFNQTVTICSNQESSTTTSSSQSDASSCITKGSAGSHSDEVLLLATSRPKRKAGRRIFKETRHPVYRGVRKRNGDKWVCEMREPNKKSRIWLGTYPTPEMAARAHDVAALALRGKSACLNFADSCWNLRIPASSDAIEIRRAASEAAELFRSQKSQNESVVDSSEVCSEDKENESLLFIDEEAIFDMPRLLVDMAEGLLLSPPQFEEEIVKDLQPYPQVISAYQILLLHL